MDHVQQKVAQQEKIRMDIINRINEIDESIAVALNHYNQMLDAGQVELSASSNLSHYVKLQKRQREAWVLRRVEQDKVLREVRQELQEAMIKKKSLELLKEKEFRRFQQHIAREDEKFLEEMTLARLNR